MADPRENPFQREIIDALTTPELGWKEGKSADYDKARALYGSDLLAFFKATSPDEWAKFSRHYPRNPEDKLLDQVAKHLDKEGTLKTLRHGFKDRGARIKLAQFRPDHPLAPKTNADYQQNILRVVPEVTYSPHGGSGRLDLVLFLNGIPVATLELKSEFRQPVQNAIDQYREDRLPKDPKTGKPEPLLSFLRGALVHFAVSQTEVFMTTELKGGDTVFLPFNQGREDGSAGNPPMSGDHPTSYLWREILARDNWLDIVGRFVYLDEKQKEDALGRKYTDKTLIFPRYHQWDVITRLMEQAREESSGRRFLIQHSAGSGKSNSIAWLAHQLASLRNQKTGEKLVDSVIVITDRTVLDKQLQETIYQVDHTSGVVERIGMDEEGMAMRESKSKQLRDALVRGTPIIIVTIQTFPHVLDEIQGTKTLRDKRFAVIADEAHTSQSGRTAIKLRQVLLAEERDEDTEISSTEALRNLIEARHNADNISYFAFTATPTAKTLELFGQPPDPSLPIADDNRPRPFHVYSMRQAIEEGFILDVLKNFTQHQSAFQIGEKGIRPDKTARKKEAKRAIAKWLRLHPYNISQKVRIIVEHFNDNVAAMLGGQAKAMVVTSGRPDAVRYKLAIDNYIAEQGYTMGTLVAFSGTVIETPDDLPSEDVARAASLAKVGTDSLEFSESSMNPGTRGKDLRDAFDSDDYQVMIVANKFQTGFDQPKLVAMYVDKKLSGVDAVQTLSRLNRTYPGKDKTFVVDFVNDPETIRKSFEPFYQTAELSKVSDPNVIYEQFDTLRDAQIYRWDEVEAFVKALHDKTAEQAALLGAIQPAVERYKKQYEEGREAYEAALKDLERAERQGDATGAQHAEHDKAAAEEKLEQMGSFRVTLKTYLRHYEFLSQIIDYDDEDLEKLSIFGQELLRQLPTFGDRGSIDLGALELTHYRLAKQKEQDLKLEADAAPTLQGITAAGTASSKQDEEVPLADVISELNNLFGEAFNDDDLKNYAVTITDKISENDQVVQQVENNPPDQVMIGDFRNAVSDAVINGMQKHEQLAMRVLEDEEVAEHFAQIILKMMLKRGKGGRS